MAQERQHSGRVYARTNESSGESVAQTMELKIESAQTSATTGANCWGETFNYDIWANLLSIGALSGYAGCTQENLSVVATGSNQIGGDTYDVSGNLTTIPGTGGASYAYNAESQLSSTAGVTYTYDGDGKRVKKSSGTLYWYGMGTDTLDETDLSGSLTNEYVFFNGKRIARRDASSNVFYYAEDHLGTSRAIAEILSGQSTATLCYDADFYPFGGERAVTTTCAQNYKFTGKERDTESGLDNFGARYDSSSMGRFMSPDNPKFSEKADPQTWNLYSYVSNNPLSRIDFTGKNWFYINGKWQWHKGKKYTYTDSQGNSHTATSSYTHLLIIQKTGHLNQQGAAEVRITLWGNSNPATSKPLAQAYGFTGGPGVAPAPNGNYEINLTNRGGVDTNRSLAVLGGYALAPFHNGIQEVGTQVPAGNGVINWQDDWGALRANLTRNGEGTPYYLYGKGLYFTEGHAYTAGCVCDPYLGVLKQIFTLDPAGVGEGDKNGRIAATVEKAPN